MRSLTQVFNLQFTELQLSMAYLSLSFNKLKKFSFNGGAAREKRLTGVSSTSYHNLYLANYNLLTPRAETSIRATE